MGFNAQEGKVQDDSMWPGGTPLVNDLQVFPLQEVAGARLSCQHHGGSFPDDLLLFSLRHGSEPLLQAQFPLAAEEQQEAHLAKGQK